MSISTSVRIAPLILATPRVRVFSVRTSQIQSFRINTKKLNIVPARALRVPRVSTARLQQVKAKPSRINIRA